VLNFLKKSGLSVDFRLFCGRTAEFVPRFFALMLSCGCRFSIVHVIYA